MNLTKKVFLAGMSATICLAAPAVEAQDKVVTKDAVVSVFMECINDGIALIPDTEEFSYAIDNPFDGVAGADIGGNAYEIYSLDIRETANSIWVVLNGNMPITGIDAPSANDENIGWGDLFFNFTGEDFSTASNQGKLFGVRFAETNDSFAPKVGLYSNVTATSVTSINSSFGSLSAYNHYVKTNCKKPGCAPSLGDLAADSTYFDPTKSMNAITSGTFLKAIAFLSNDDLQAAGYDFNKALGQHTIAFSFDKSAISQSAPEPPSIAGLAIVGGAIAIRFLKKRF